MLADIFKNLDLPEQAVSIYMQLLEHGPSAAGQLAKKLSLPRSTLYGFLENLLNKGLINQSEKNSTKIWIALPPSEIARLIDDRVSDWQKTQLKFSSLLLDLEKRRQLDFSLPAFQIFEGVQGVQRILKDLLLYRDITSQAFWPAKDMLKILGADFHHQLNLQRIRQNIYTQGIWPADKLVDMRKHPYFGTGQDFKREIRQAPAGISTSMGYWAYADKVAFISSQKECFGFIVESRELRQLLKTQFDVIWQLSSPLSVDKKYTLEYLKEV